MTYNKEDGFTLIELMITVAIIGILSAIALPAYQDYIVKTQVADAIVLLDSAKVDISIQTPTSGVFPADTDELAELGTGIKGGYGLLTTENITNPNGDVVYIFSSGNIKLRNKKLVYSLTIDGTGNPIWVCKSDISSKYIPHNCSSI